MKGELRIMNRLGDSVVTWDTEDKASVEKAERTFRELRDRSMIGFAIQTAEGTPKDRPESVQIGEFDPNAKEILMVPPIAGGSQ